MPHRKRRDANHAEIKQALLRAGVSVVDVADTGCGFDLIAARKAGDQKKTVALEVKDGSKPPSHRKLTPNEARVAATWQGEYAVVKSVDEAFVAVGLA
jgi:hypothetical protein